MMCGSGGSCGSDEVHCTDEDFREMHETIAKIDCNIAEWRRYLYRNVACEARKTSDLYRHIPNLPGWD
jgi:hypothetical protein